MNETLYRWTFNFHKVVRQQNSGAVEDFILPYSAVYLRIQKWKNYWNRSTFVKVIVKIKVARFLWPTVYIGDTDNICDILCAYFYRAVMPQYIVRLQVCPSVTFRYSDHIGWNTSKIISPPNSDRIVRWGFLGNRRRILRLHRPTIFRALTYWAHRAVILAIAWFSCSLM